MAKTKEELDALKEKVKELKGELKELSEEELKAIAGGDNETDCQKMHCPQCGSGNVYYDSIRMWYICRDCGYEF